MKGITTWSYREYVPLEYPRGDIYICRLSPYPNSFTIDWYSTGESDTYTVY